MEKDQIIILEDRGLISVSGEDAEDFLQNIITNDVKKVTKSQTLFSGIFTPQGKYLFEFFVLKSEIGFYLDCDGETVNEIITLSSSGEDDIVLKSSTARTAIKKDFIAFIVFPSL